MEGFEEPGVQGICLRVPGIWRRESRWELPGPRQSVSSPRSRIREEEEDLPSYVLAAQLLPENSLEPDARLSLHGHTHLHKFLFCRIAIVVVLEKVEAAVDYRRINVCLECGAGQFE